MNLTSTKEKTNKSRHKRGLSLGSTGQATLSAGSSIPSKYQRVIIQKTKNNNSPVSKSLMHQRSSSTQISNKKHNSFIYDFQSQQTTNDQSQQAFDNSQYTNYLEQKSIIQAGFGSSTIRFDQNLENQLLFNRSPGPGSYNLRQERNKTKVIDPNSSLMTISQNTLNNSLMYTLNSPEETYQLNETLNQVLKYSRSIQKKLNSDSLEEGVKFPKALRFPDQAINSPSPWQYDPDVPEKAKGVLKMHNENKLSIPSHVLNNPLNFVRPMVVNLYYKKANPGVGTYDPIHPDEIQTKLDNKMKQSYKCVFESQIQRNTFLRQGDKEIMLNPDRSDFYEVEQSMAALNKVKMDMPSFAFQKPVRPIIKQELPKQLQQIINQDANSLDQTNLSQPEYLGSLDEKIAKTKLRAELICSEDQRDRFGNILMPRKPYEEQPGPGAYNNVDIEKIKNSDKKSGMINPVQQTYPKIVKEEKQPSPWTYNQEAEGKQVSFHFWGNDNLKQPWIQ